MFEGRGHQNDIIHSNHNLFCSFSGNLWWISVFVNIQISHLFKSFRLKSVGCFFFFYIFELQFLLPGKFL